MSNAAVVRDGNLLKIVPLPEAAGAGGVRAGAGQAGYGVTVVPLRYTSAASVATAAENFMSRPGAIRVDARHPEVTEITSRKGCQGVDGEGFPRFMPLLPPACGYISRAGGSVPLVCAC
jgi:general secretion pathway protein D